MKKKILIILSSEPLYGGLYQYSIMLTDALVSSNKFDIQSIHQILKFTKGIKIKQR